MSQMTLGEWSLLCSPVSPARSGGNTSFYLIRSLKAQRVNPWNSVWWLVPLSLFTEQVLGTEHFTNSLTSFSPLNLKFTQVKYYNHDKCYKEEVLDIKLNLV